MPTPPGPSAPVNPIDPAETYIRMILKLAGTASFGGLPAAPTAKLAPMPNLQDYLGAAGAGQDYGTAQENAALGGFAQDAAQKMQLADMARRAFAAARSAPMPELPAPQQTPFSAAGSMLANNMASVLMGRPDIGGEAFRTIQGERQNRQQLALKQREDNLGALREEYTRAADAAMQAGDFNMRIKYLRDIQKVDAQREKIQAAQQSYVTATSATNLANTEQQNRLASDVYTAQARAAADLAQMRGSVFASLMSGLSKGAKQDITTPQEWNAAMMKTLGEYPQAMKDMGNNKGLASAITKQRLIFLGPQLFQQPDGSIGRETADQARARFTQTPSGIPGMEKKPLLDLKNPGDGRLWSTWLAIHFPEEYQRLAILKAQQDAQAEFAKIGHIRRITRETPKEQIPTRTELNAGK